MQGDVINYCGCRETGNDLEQIRKENKMFSKENEKSY